MAHCCPEKDGSLPVLGKRTCRQSAVIVDAANAAACPQLAEPDVRPQTSRTSQDVRLKSAKWGKADLDQVAVTSRNCMNTRP